nr:hypothetical protein [Pandoravirus aubagnensis]
MYATGSISSSGNDGVGHIGSPTLPASRPLCIPVRFQPLGGTSSSARWMGGTGALAAAASTLPLPLDDSGSSGGDDNYSPPIGMRYETDGMCAADVDVATGLSAMPSSVDTASTTMSAPTARPWLWPVVGALLLVLVLCGGGAAWMVWQKRQRARSSGDAPVTGDASRGVAAPGVAGASSGLATVAAPMSPLPQAPVYFAQDGTLAAQPPSMPLDPPAQTGATLPTSWTRTAAAAGHWTQPLAQPAMSVGVGSPAQQQHHQQQYRDQAIATVPGQGQARGTYVMVERPPLRMRNVTSATRRAAVYSDDDDDDDDYGGDDNVVEGNSHSSGRQNARRVSTQSRGVSRSDSWTRRAPPPRQMAASPQESHYGEDAMVRPELLRHSAWSRGADVDARPKGRDMDDNINAGGDTMQLRQHPRPARPANDNGDDDDNDSLIDGVADYWADAERARQTYFASPQERAAHAMSLGPRAYSPDGTPMPLRG